jgi:BON domain-containing protein
MDIPQEAPMYKCRLAHIIGIATLAMSFAGCAQTTNENANRNVNTNLAPVNTNRPAANANVNANTTTRRTPTREEYEKNKERYLEQAKEAGRKIGTGLNDGWLWVKTRYDLAAAEDLRDSTINVDVDNGVVTLTGTVATAVQKVKAESVVKSVEGVKSVRNLLKVSPAGNTNTASHPANHNANKKY